VAWRLYSYSGVVWPSRLSGSPSVSTITGTSDVSGICPPAAGFVVSSTTVTGVSTQIRTGAGSVTCSGSVSGVLQIASGVHFIPQWRTYRNVIYRTAWVSPASVGQTAGTITGFTTSVGIGGSTAEATGTITADSTVSSDVLPSTVSSFVWRILNNNIIYWSNGSPSQVSVGAAAGVGTVLGSSSFASNVAGTITGTSTVSGAGFTSTTDAPGTCTGLTVVDGEGASIFSAIGISDGVTFVISVDTTYDGLITGTSEVIGVGTAIGESIGTWTKALPTNEVWTILPKRT